MVENIFTLFLAFSTALLATADVPVCDGIQEFNLPQNLNTSIWYPTNFSTVAASVFPKNYNCEYQINVPIGMFARVWLNVIANSTGGSIPVTVIDQLGRKEELINETSNFYFLTPSGSIRLSTSIQEVRFGFSVTWNHYNNSEPHRLNVSQTDTLPILEKMDELHPYIVKADTQVSVTTMRYFDYLDNILRSIVFFDGPDWNSTCLGNAKQLFDGNTQFVSTGNTMTVMCLEWDYAVYFFTFVFQDYELTKDIVRFQSVICSHQSACGTIMLDGSNGPVVFQSYETGGELTDVITNMEGTGNLDVYIGTVSVSKKNLIASYNVSSNNTLNLPQQFDGVFKSYVATGGIVNLTITRDPSAFYPTNDFGRKGFISSYNYATNTSSQSSHAIVEAPCGQVAKFRFVILQADMVERTELRIIGYGSSTVYFKVYDQSALPTLNLFQEFTGTSLEVRYDTYRPNIGFLMDFQVKKSTTCKPSVLLCMIIAVLTFILF